MRLRCSTIYLTAALFCLCGHPVTTQVRPAKGGPESAIRPIRALLAIAEEPVKPGSSCDQGRLLPAKPGPQQVGDTIAILLAYHDSGINSINGSCDKEGDATCFVTLKHQRSRRDDLEFTTFRFKIVNNKVQPGSLECEMSP